VSRTPHCKARASEEPGKTQRDSSILFPEEPPAAQPGEAGGQEDQGGRLGDGLFLIRFEGAPAPHGGADGQTAARASTGSAEPDSDANARIAELQQELRTKEEYLQSTIEEMETSSEELRSSHEEMQSVNEELQSANEELQSMNEELETSKEELQSLNEELVTVNAELHGKMDELARANDDMKNLLDSTKIATVFLDNQLCIKRFTSEATKIINLIQSDVGRPVSHIVSNLEEDTLSLDAQQVMDSLVSKERQVRTREGRWYLNRVIPYRTLDNVIDGVVLTFTDITEQKLAESATAARNLAEGIVDTVREPLVALDGGLRVIAANGAFYNLFNAAIDSTIAQSFFELGNGQWDAPKLRELLEKLLPQNTQIENFVVEHEFPKIGPRKMIINARRIYHEGVGTETILLTINDATASE
jgi:two-component system CheB/CheR fusion protein